MSAATRCDDRGGPTAETLTRAAEVARWLVAGNGTREIYSLAGDAWGIKHRQTDNLIALARKLIQDAWEIERPGLVALLLSRTDEVFRMALEQRNSGAAIAAIATAAKLAKL